MEKSMINNNKLIKELEWLAYNITNPNEKKIIDDAICLIKYQQAKIERYETDAFERAFAKGEDDD